MEPWDGPAAIAFTDGRIVGATLDRNGLRPARYVVTNDDRVILASEAGVIDVPPELVQNKGRLQPGRMFLVDIEEGRILDDDEVKRDIANRWPYRRWLERNVFVFDELKAGPAAAAGRRGARSPAARVRVLRRGPAPAGDAHGGDAATSPPGSMGNDAPLAVLERSRAEPVRLLPPALRAGDEPAHRSDPREAGHVAGHRHRPRRQHLRRVAGALPPPGAPRAHPRQRARRAHQGHGRAGRLRAARAVHAVRKGIAGAGRAKLCDASVQAVEDGADVLILSDRGVDARRKPIPVLLALSAVHQRLVRDGIRCNTGLLVETGEAREVHHFALLIGFGARRSTPGSRWTRCRPWGASPSTRRRPPRNYVKAVNEGLLKVMSKMGI